jgi:hypothetical protein
MSCQINTCFSSPRGKELFFDATFVIVALAALSIVAVVSLCTSHTWKNTTIVGQYFTIFFVSAGFAIGSALIAYPFIEKKIKGRD